MENAAAIVEWVKDTGLMPYLQRVVPEDHAEFLADYPARVRRAYPALSDGKALSGFHACS